MTPAKSDPTNVVVVDGSNIATEGRSMPSLTQLNEAVMAFTEEYPEATITVVVDATFGHRIDKKELAEFDAAVAHNELVAPPAGAIGRGDAFVLSIANKVGARILSNDSFQEFHGDYPWLFDEGRLIGGKPVPFVGWVFVERLPVKGPISRKATRASRGGRERDGRDRDGRDRDGRQRRTASKAASLPMPVPTAPPPGTRRAAAPELATPAPVAVIDGTPARAPAPSSGGGPVNDLLPFLDFVEHHPVGSSVNGVVESYSSHGAYVMIGDLRGYVPLRLMGEPPPRSAREVMKLGDAVTLVVTSFAPGRRSVDLAIPKVALVTELTESSDLEELAEAVTAAPAKGPRKRAAKKAAPPVVAGSTDDAPAPPEAASEPVPAAPAAPARKKAAAKRSAAKKAATPPTAVVEQPAEPAEPAPADDAARAPRKRGAAKKAAAEAAPVKKAAPATRSATRSAVKKVAATTPAAADAAPVPARKAAAKTAGKATAKKAATAPKAKAAAKKASAKRAPRKAAAPEGTGPG
jgi:hypothetical protein